MTVKINKQKLSDNRKKFNTIFNRKLVAYMHPIFGFDIIQFNNDIQVPDGQSCKDFVKEKYGDNAVQLLERLL